MKPRDYQLAAADALWSQLHTNPTEDPLVVMPTGSGKSLSMAMMIAGLSQVYPWVRILSLVHVKELVEGNYKTLLRYMPTAPAGVYSAGVGRRDTHAPITFCGIDSIVDKEAVFGHIDFVIIDEAHRMSDKDGSTYQKVITALRAVNPNLLVIGFTATDFRLGMGRLTEGGLFDRVAFDLSSGAAFVWLIQQGYLIKPVPKRPRVQVDSSGVGLQAGEFNNKDAAAAFDDQDILLKAVDEIILEGQERRAWLIFAQSIEHAELIAEMLQQRGYPVEAVHSKRKDRDEVLAKFARGELRGVVNKDILTTGYDNVNIDLMAILRLTNSPSLWVQMLGRGTRPAFILGYDLTTVEGRLASIAASHKHDCLVLDFAANSERLGPINYPTIPKRRRKGDPGDPPMRCCPECQTYNHISIPACEVCGYVFPVKQKLRTEAGAQELVLDLTQPLVPIEKVYGVFGVTQIIASLNTGKNGKPDTLKVAYHCGMVRRFTTWVCLDHLPGSFAHKKAAEWWRQHSEDRRAQVPASVAEGLTQFTTLRTPKHIKVWLNTKYPEIEAYDFAGTAFELPKELGGGRPDNIIGVETPTEAPSPPQAYDVGAPQEASTPSPYTAEDFY